MSLHPDFIELCGRCGQRLYRPFPTTACYKCGDRGEAKPVAYVRERPEGQDLPTAEWVLNLADELCEAAQMVHVMARKCGEPHSSDGFYSCPAEPCYTWAAILQHPDMLVVEKGVSLTEE